MINKAIEKITKEMMENDNPCIRDIEEYLTSICKTKDIAEKILDKNKTLEGAYKALEEEAKRRAGGNKVVCIPDKEAFEIIKEYFGVKSEREIVNVMDFI